MEGVEENHWGSGDQGGDVVAEKKNVVVALQALWNRQIDNSAVQEVVAAKVIYSATVAIVVSNQIYTDSAHQPAAANNVLLYTMMILLRWIHFEALTRRLKAIYTSKFNLIPQTAPAQPFPVEGLQIVRLLADADEFSDGQAEFLLDRHDHPALARANEPVTTIKPVSARSC